ncbi:MAG: hypothetical protein V1916_00915, partial [Patescibacteria group bacterium]
MTTPTLTPEDKAILVRRFRLQMWLGLGTIMFIGLLVASFLVFRQPAQAPTSSSLNVNTVLVNQNTNRAQPATPVAITATVDTSAWQLFTNDEFAYAVQYPADWT